MNGQKDFPSSIQSGRRLSPTSAQLLKGAVATRKVTGKGKPWYCHRKDFSRAALSELANGTWRS
jgi:hypothetical protein